MPAYIDRMHVLMMALMRRGMSTGLNADRVATEKGRNEVGPDSTGADVAHRARVLGSRASMGIRGGLFRHVLCRDGSLRGHRGSSTISVATLPAGPRLHWAIPVAGVLIAYVHCHPRFRDCSPTLRASRPMSLFSSCIAPTIYWNPGALPTSQTSS